MATPTPDPTDEHGMEILPLSWNQSVMEPIKGILSAEHEIAGFTTLIAIPAYQNVSQTLAVEWRSIRTDQIDKLCDQNCTTSHYNKFIYFPLTATIQRMWLTENSVLADMIAAYLLSNTTHIPLFPATPDVKFAIRTLFVFNKEATRFSIPKRHTSQVATDSSALAYKQRVARETWYLDNTIYFQINVVDQCVDVRVTSIDQLPELWLNSATYYIPMTVTLARILTSGETTLEAFLLQRLRTLTTQIFPNVSMMIWNMMIWI